MSIVSDINSWLIAQPEWIHLAADLLCKGRAIDGSLVDEVTGLLMDVAKGHKLARPSAVDFQIYDQTNEGDSFNITRIENIAGVNRLSTGSEIQFCDGVSEAGLSIVYGPNGSGKTGYTRILKVSARRMDGRRLLPDVFAKVSSSAKWEISLKLPDEDNCQVVTLSPLHNDRSILDAIQIFDEELAVSYRSQDRELSVSPPILKIFDDLISLVDLVKAKLAQIKANDPSLLPIVPIEYQKYLPESAYKNLASFSNDSELRSACLFSAEDEKLLQKSVEATALFASDSAISNMRKREASLTQLKSKITVAFASVSQNALTDIINLRSEVLKAEAAAEAANAITSNSAVLSGIGSEQWASLWQAARKYSNELAYKEIEFPNIGSQAKCVLCHQELSDSSKKLFLDFDNLVKGSATKAVEEARSKLRIKLSSLPSNESVELLASQILNTEGLDASEQEATLVRLEINNRVKAIIDEEVIVKDSNVLGLIADRLSKLLEDVTKSINQATDPQMATQRQRVVEESQRLGFAKWISQQVDSLLTEKNRISRHVVLDRALAMCNTADLTMQKSKLYEAIVTKEVVDSFIGELKELSASSINVVLRKTRSSKGKTLHKPVLSQCTRSSELADILSEGEQRILALAAFLADAGTVANRAPFVFDDPVSSLDHLYENVVAKRLVKLSLDRQVIVFTHRLSFVFALERQAGKLSIAPVKIGLHSNAIGSGIAGDFPMDKTPKSLANTVITDCAKLMKRISDLPPDQLRFEMLSPFSRMRRAVEMSIEKVLLSSIVKRFDQAIHADNGLTNLAIINEQDCELIDNLMTTYSRELHVQPDEADDTPITVEKLQSDAKLLIEWIDQFTKRKPA